MLTAHAINKFAYEKAVVILFNVFLLLSLTACGGSDGGSTGHDATAARSSANASGVVAVSKSTKRGVAYGGNSAADLTALSSGITWWYNWSPTPETGAASVYQSLGVEFAPMVWGGTPNADQLALQIPDGVKYLLSFNEPNFKSQANKTPTQAAALWPILEDIARRKNLQLSAPAVNYCGDCVSEGGVTFTDPIVYLDAFFAACPTCKVDFIPVHWYACDVSALQWYIDKFKKYNKPIWVTEFACGDKPHDQITLDVQKNYMAAAVNYLENEPAVARYSWFSGRNDQIPNINLLGADGKLTELGQLYVTLPTATVSSAEVALTPVKAVASASENAALGPDKAIDKNLSTRWSSAFSDQQWIYLDFGSTVNISHVRINWEAAYGKDYELQTSNDAVTWTTIKTVTGGSGGVVDFTGLTGSGRYLRMNGIKRSSQYGYSIFEMTAFTQTTATAPATQTLLTPVKAVASGSEGANLGPDKAIDNNLGTRWSSAFNDQQWMYVDFGATATISRVKINWENAHAQAYELQVSNDAIVWTTIKSVTASQGGIEDMTVSGTGRYLRMNGIKRSSQYGYSIFEIAAWGTLSGTTTSDPTPTPTPTPTPMPTTQTLLTPLRAFASSLESPQLEPYYAIDGNLTSRWSSAFSDAQWIYVDYGAAATFSRLKITWQNSYGKDYQVQVSNDAATWTTIKTVTGGSGGVEDMTIAGSGRYLRLNLTKRSSPYGYSMYEIAAYGTLTGAITTPPAPTPPAPLVPITVSMGGSNVTYLPLFADNAPVNEQIQYTEADGTLVSYIGFRPTERHARERGEAWDVADTGPGRYFTFPTFYFQNRTMGLIVKDHVPGGRQKIEIYLQVNNGVFDGTTFSLFRNILNPTVRDYGWALNTGFNNPKEGNLPICRAGEYNCMIVVDSNWRTNPHSQLRIGDKIELAPAPRLQRPTVDGGGDRYYSFEQLYVVGVGLVPWYGIAPNLDSEPLPASTLLGGLTSVSFNYSEEPHRVFQQMANNIGIANTQRFVEGRRLFHTSFADGKHSEHPDSNPVFTAHIGQLGPRFNQSRCIECHALNGRSPAAVIGAPINSMSVLTASQVSGDALIPDPTYGFNIQQQAKSSTAPDYSVAVKSYVTTVRTLPDGEKVTLSKPVYDFKGPVPAMYSVRQAPQVIGLGLLESVPEATILALADPADKNGDGVRGVPNWVTDPESGQTRLGRFGWKAAKASLRQQVGDALVKDMGVVSPVYPSRSCQRGSANCRTSDGTTGVSETELQRLSQYLELIGVPAQRSLRSGYPDGVRVAPELDVNPAQIQRGATLFAQAKCTACHVSELKTGNGHPFAELRNQTIRPFTDLLLHDMGPDLADTLPEGQAKSSMWRTAPLWGIGSLPYVQRTAAEINGPNFVPGDVSNARYLHDGRAKTLKEAIIWHGGEATNSRSAFEGLPKADRDALIAFLKSL